jgi:hypothetical protein
MYALMARLHFRGMRVVALLGLVLVPAAMALAPGSAAGSGTIDYDLECQPAGIPSPPYTVDDTNTSRIAYNGSWKAETPMKGQYMGTQHITNVGGSTASFALPSSPYVFAFGYTKMRNAGKAAIYYNNQYVTTIDMFASSDQYNCAMVFYPATVPAGTFTVKALNQRNPASGGTYINVDYFHFES